MIQLVYSAVAADHLDLFQFTNRSRDSHILLSGFHPQHLLFQKIVDPVADDPVSMEFLPTRKNEKLRS